MASHTKDMTVGKPLPLIFRFALPLMVGSVFQQMYIMVDTLVVGRALGVEALAALGATDWLNWLVIGIIQGLAQGFAILMSKEFGAHRMESLRKVVGSSATLSVYCALFFLGLGQLIAGPMLRLLRTPAEVVSNALLYVRIIYLGIPVVMAYNLLACVLRAFGDSRTPLAAMIVASLANIVLDVLFVVVFRWGIAGAAVATTLAQLVSSVYCLAAMRRIPELKMQKGDFALTLTMAKKLLLLGLPAGFQNAVIAAGGLVIQLITNSFGMIFLAGMTATNKIFGLLEMAGVSYGYSMITYAGQNLGAQRPDRIRSGMRWAVFIALVTSTAIAACMIVFGKSILIQFISGTPGEIEATLQVAYHYLVVMSAFLPVLYILHVTRSAIQGMENTVLPMVSGIAELTMRTTCAPILPHFIGQQGVFYAEIAAWIGAVIILVPSYFRTIAKISEP